MIEVHNVAKSFNKIQAVKDVSLKAKDARITALLGPNGAGKSTTFRILSTMIRPDMGNALIDGVDVQTDPMAVRKSIGVLPHNSGLYGRLTGIENIEYFGRLQGLPAAELKARIASLTRQLKMEDFANRRTAGFSQGERIKVALARALVHNPKHLILDEPTNGLDVMATRALREIIEQLKDAGKCILFSSHVMQEVDALCDDVIVISEGEVKFDGTIATLRDHAGTQDLEEAFIKMAKLGDKA
ncbi:MAG: ATP-binding cassette domain-containing protein [Pseudomonadota bacterium]|jgi:sodium transport system ATP-binding protein|nr:ATP-binding cassette domain-containing protein [Pseudomonadota bacterium]